MGEPQDPTSTEAQERLRRLREELEEAISRRDLAAEGDERGDGHHHPAEAATDSDRRERELRDQLRFKEREQRIRDAEEALEAGTYGVCVDCGGPIPEGRLRAVPDATRCVPCQTAARRAGRA